MIQKKVCMLGSFAVGKTSLVRRYVHSIFSDAYKTTVGVKVDRKQVSVDGTDVNLMLWDLHGDDELQPVRASYLRGASGALLVIDPTRPETLERVVDLDELLSTVEENATRLAVLNKADLRDDWRVSSARIDALRERGLEVLVASALTGDGVEEAFAWLGRRMIGDAGEWRR